MIGPLIHRYVAIRTLRGVLTAFAVVTTIIMLVDFVEGSRNLGDDGVSSLQVIGLTLLKIPKLIEQTIPFVVLFGVMGTFYSMNRRSELIVMRAAGLSVWRFIRPAVTVSALLGVIWAVGLNPLASRMMNWHDAARTEWSEGSPDMLDDLWIREGEGSTQTVIHARSFDPGSRLLVAPTFYIMKVTGDDTTRFSHRYDAASATLLPGEAWQLLRVTENRTGESVKALAEIRLPTRLSVEDLMEQKTRAVDPPFWDIPATIRQYETAGFSTRSLHMQLNRLLALPLTLIAMTLIAAGVSLSFSREGGALRLLILGAVIGFGVFFADSVMAAFGDVSVLPVIIASWSVPVLALMGGVIHLSRIEDG